MITKDEAVVIAEKAHGPNFKFFGVTHGVPSNFNIYGGFLRAPDDVWCVSCSSHPDRDDIVSSCRAIVISKDTGKILYDGGAGDEG